MGSESERRVGNAREQLGAGMEADARAEPRVRIEADAREERMDRVAVLWGEITAATREFLRAVAESDRHRDWAEAGFASCAEWLAWQIGVTRNTANEKVRAARALEHLPVIAEAMGRGELSFSKVRALTRVAKPENERELLELAKAGSAANLERVIRSWKVLSRRDEANVERARHRARRFSIVPDEDGTYVLSGRLTPEVAVVLMRAVEAASDALFRQDDRPEPAQRRADALGLLAERGLSTGFGGEAPVSGSRAERYQVVLHVEAPTLRESGEPGMSELEAGTRVTAETARRLSCDASRVEVRHPKPGGAARPVTNRATGRAEKGGALSVGRSTRTVPPALRRAFDVRDRGCRFPGCGLRFTDAHHIRHWADGGRTGLDNLVLLCRRHHRLVHEEGHRICMDRKRTVVFYAPNGRVLADVPKPPRLGEEEPVGGRAEGRADGWDQGRVRGPLDALVRRNRERGVRPMPLAGAPRWKRDHLIPWSVEAAAREALDCEPLDEATEPLDDEPIDSQPMDAACAGAR